jgi:hypothetical protein
MFIKTAMIHDIFNLFMQPTTFGIAQLNNWWVALDIFKSNKLGSSNTLLSEFLHPAHPTTGYQGRFILLS